LFEVMVNEALCFSLAAPIPAFVRDPYLTAVPNQSPRPRDSAGRSIAQPALDRGEQSAAGGGERHFGADGARMLRLDCLAQFDRAEKIAFVRGYLARG